jgi:hypothetical protein
LSGDRGSEVGLVRREKSIKLKEEEYQSEKKIKICPVK